MRAQDIRCNAADSTYTFAPRCQGVLYYKI
jgi:hypothetical protein